MKKVCVIGLGYVGLPVLIHSIKAGYKAVGVDINKNRIKMLKKRKDIKPENLFTEPPKEFFDYIIICIPTPVRENKKPDYTYLKKAAESIAKRLNKGETVILESTVAPGTTANLFIPILEKSGLKAGHDFQVAYCPERISPGDPWELNQINRVLGALNKKSLEKAKEFYSNILEKPPFVVSRIEVAELTKIYENMFRDINIAFANEMAKTCDLLKIDALEVIKAAATKPFGFMPFYPGLGVGGHCIPVDPYYLIEEVERKKVNTLLFRFVREINDGMIDYVLFKFYKALNEIGLNTAKSSIGFLGLTYKPNVDDIRESPAIRLLREINTLNYKNIKIYDPYYTKMNTVNSLDEAVNADIIIVAVKHDSFKNVEEKIISSKAKLIVDCSNKLDKNRILESGKRYIGVGR